jgi:hypothetical protein
MNDVKRIQLPVQAEISAPGFIFLDDIRLPFRVIKETGEIEFMDKNKHRSELRGYRFIRVSIDDFKKILDFVMKSC